MDRRLPLALAAALVSVLVPLAAEHRGGTAIAVRHCAVDRGIKR